MTNRINLQSAKKSIEPTNPNSCSISKPPRKQFELLYRTKDGSPSNQQYESVIFVKTKKCPTSPTNVDKSIKSTKTNQKQLKNIIKNLQKQIKMRQLKQTNVTKMNRNKQLSSHLNKSKGNGMKQISHQNILAYKKQKNQKRKKQKSPEIHTRKSPTNKQKEYMKIRSQERKIGHQSLTNNYQIALPIKHKEYIFTQDKFLPVKQISVNRLQAKFYETFRQKTHQNTQIFQNDQLIKYQHHNMFQTEKEVQKQNNMSFSQQSIQTTKNNEERQQIDQNQEENNILKTMKMLQKIMIIQRWWKKIFNKKKLILQKQTEELSKVQESRQTIIYNINQAYQSRQITQENDCNLQKQRILMKPPVLQCISNNNENYNDINIYKKQHRINSQQNILYLRQNAILLQKETHIKILIKLLESQKITDQIYKEKLKIIEKNYQNELTQLNKIKNILLKNAEQFQKIMKKTKEDMVLVQTKEITDQDINRIFGHQKIEIQPETFEKEKIVVTREKSSGCHFSSIAHSPSSIHQKFFKQLHQHDDSSEQSPGQEDTTNLDQSQENEFYEGMGNIYPQFISNTNFRQLLEQYKQRQDLKVYAEERIAIQMGMIPAKNQRNIQKGQINTSIAAIHHFLTMFFKFYIYYYKEDFLRLMNMPYGFNPQRRLAYMQKYEDLLPDVDQQGIIYGLDNIISEQILQDFHQNYYQTQIEGKKKQSLIFQKIHNKIIFDAFNEGLNYFRPYFNINGPPYSWNYSQKALTFFFIAEENIKEVFEKTQYRILKWASSLCGIIVDSNSKGQKKQKSTENTQQIVKVPLQQTLQSYRNKNSPVIIEMREQRLFKTEKMDIEEHAYQWFLHQQQKTALLYEISILILDELGQEILNQFNEIKQNHEQYQQDEQEQQWDQQYQQQDYQSNEIKNGQIKRLTF